jgi:Domain of unknown function (DUF4129)
VRRSTESAVTCQTEDVSRRVLLPLGLGVSGLLVLAAVASRGRPLGGGSNGTGPTAGFFDYVFTTIVLLAAAMTVALVVTLSFVRPARGKGPAPARHYFISMLSLAGALVLAWALVHSGFEKRLQKLEQQPKHPAGQTQQAAPPPASRNVRGARLRWDEVAIVLGLLAAAGAVVVVMRSRARLPASLGRASHRAVSLALDESLDDLRSEPDLRKAIVAAYARMERALAGAGLPRRPAEAPVEYLERALLSLDTSASAVRRLTDLFEWAKFSHHEPEPSMRDEAVDALVAVRDELRAPGPVTVTVTEGRP